MLKKTLNKVYFVSCLVVTCRCSSVVEFVLGCEGVIIAYLK